MQDAWKLLLELLIALGGALIVGLIFERLGLSWIAGCLVAGVAIGPTALGLIQSGPTVSLIAEIGVALLLFTIGLEFSFKSLKRLGAGLMLGASGGIAICVGLGAAAAAAFGFPWQTGATVGAVISVSSTAVVLRVLKDVSDLDTVHGRRALGVLLVQDVAMVPLVLLVTFLGAGSGNLGAALGGALLKTVGLVVGLVLFISLVMPRLLHEKVVAKNRELPILMGAATCLGATWAAHELKISPALGAFFAGMLLADTKWSDQMRADILPLRTLFVSIFFVSVGLLADIRWIAAQWPVVLASAFLVIAIKTLLYFLALRWVQRGVIESLAAAIAVSQIGEFGFVLAGIGKTGGLVPDDLFQLIVSVTLLTMLATPFIASNAMPLARWVAKRLSRGRKLAKDEREERKANPLVGHHIVIGYGEAGQETARALQASGFQVVVVEMSPRLAREAEEKGFAVVVGDATSHEILERAHMHHAAQACITLPDHHTIRTIVSQIRLASREVVITARSRYTQHAAELDMIGVDKVVDEELMVGREIARAAHDTKETCRLVGANDS